MANDEKLSGQEVYRQKFDGLSKRFLQLPEDILVYARQGPTPLNPCEIAVLHQLLFDWNFNESDRYVEVFNQRLMQQTGYGERAIQKATKGLADKGVIQKFETRNQMKDKLPNRFYMSKVKTYFAAVKKYVKDSELESVFGKLE